MLYNKAIEKLFFQIEEHEYKDILSVVYNRVINVEQHHYNDIVSVMYNRAIERLFYRLKSTSTRIFCLWRLIRFTRRAVPLQ